MTKRTELSTRTTRLAPSPTGTLHLGNARTFLINWALARANGWRIVMRIEDLDAPRVRPGAAEQAIDLLRWLGMDFDSSPIHQSHDLEPYRQAMSALAEARLAYTCSLSRRQIQQAASAPHAGDAELQFPSTLRSVHDDAYRFDREDTNYRFVVNEEPIVIEDMLSGASTHHPSKEVGDFIIWTKIGVPAYQLAVVVDDARQGITDVVRGDDLLPSAARQMLLYRALDLPAPRWWHVPLVTGDDGRRLAKRHGGAHLETYRQAGVPPDRIIGLLAHWCGAAPLLAEMSAEDFRTRFDPARLSRDPVVFTEAHHKWLMHDCPGT